MFIFIPSLTQTKCLSFWNITGLDSQIAINNRLDTGLAELDEKLVSGWKETVHVLQVRETEECRKDIKKSVGDLAETGKTDKKELKDKVHNFNTFFTF